ncbi:hypothetical protein O6P43_013848 [Quillaja saponaria]|uniref:Uncharacterized protein n=1 Tax=Quillaja saponaria TaxID=32244 RepID=A0AAD7LTE2_QUISA|nr:hypothetical protein O6P43_013848 [Quillaja saponaria]
MVAVFNKDLLSWHLITLKLRETLESGIAASPNSATRSIEFPEQSQQQLQKHQQEPLESLQITIRDDCEKLEEEANSPDFEWVISIKEKLEQARQDDVACSWAKLSIYRVPHYLREETEERARSCYEGPISLSSNEFVEMLILDGSFVLEPFRGSTQEFKQLGYPRNDPIFAMRGSMHSIRRDMIMLENQLPLFVLDRLLGLQLGDPEQRGLVAKLVLQFFDPLMPIDKPLTNSDGTKLESSLGWKTTFDPLSDQGGLHCLDVFRRSLLRTGSQPTPKVWIKRSSHANRVADKRASTTNTLCDRAQRCWNQV